MRKIRIKKIDFFKALIKVAIWYFNYYFLRQINPIFCGIYVTNNCNFRCAMCKIWKLRDKQTLPFNLFKKLIDDIKNTCCHLSFSGGEPLLVSDIIERIVYAKKFIPYVQLGTNGYLINKKMAKNLYISGLNEISISIDGLKKTNDKIRGIKDAFEHALKAIDNLKIYAPNINIVVNTIIAFWNIDELYQLVDLVKDLGVSQQFQPVSNIFEGKNYNEFTKNIIEKEKIKQFIKNILSEKHVVNSKYFLSKIPDYFILGKNNCLTSKCKLPLYSFEVLPDGDLFSCGILYDTGKSFSLKNQRAKEIFKSTKYKEMVKRLRECYLCKKSMYVCYIEPRITFPLLNFIKYNVIFKKIYDCKLKIRV